MRSRATHMALPRRLTLGLLEHTLMAFKRRYTKKDKKHKTINNGVYMIIVIFYLVLFSFFEF